ncbi:hypothetical protein [Nocardia asteroides]
MGVFQQMWNELPTELQDQLWSGITEHVGSSLNSRRVYTPRDRFGRPLEHGDGKRVVVRRSRWEVDITDEELGELFAARPEIGTTILRNAMGRKSFRAELIRTRDPLLAAAVAASAPDLVETDLLESSVDLVADGKDHDLLLDWSGWAYEGQLGSLSDGLQVAMDVGQGVSAGLARAEYLAKRRGGAGRQAARQATAPAAYDKLSSGISRVVAAVTVAEKVSNYGQGLVGDGARRVFHNSVVENRGAWRQALPWLLQILDPHRDEMVDGTAIALAEDPMMRAALEAAAANNQLPEIAFRAQGVQAAVSHLDTAGVVSVSAIARQTDRRRRDFPRPLAEPSATWLSDLELESMLHSAIADAQAAFADEFTDLGAHEEEGHLRSLMKEIETTLNARQQIHALQGDTNRAPDVVGAYRPYPKKEETGTGADLALVVSIEIAGRLTLAFAEFVQVKKSYQEVGAANSDRWAIKLDQLTTLLTTSPTAAYWLIGADGDIYAVPAKLIYGLAAGTNVLGNFSFTLHYTDIRHAAVSLAGYFTYLAVGTWTGNSGPEVVEEARGLRRENRTLARAVFELTVRRTPD